MSSNLITYSLVSPGGSDSKESACNWQDSGSIPGQEDPLEKGMATRSSILTGKSHGQRSLMGCRPRGRQESEATDVHSLPFDNHESVFYVGVSLSVW